MGSAAHVTVFRLLASERRSLGELLPGVIVATVGLLVLQTLGGWYVNTAIANASDTYGVFATVIALLSWLSLAAQLILIAAEVNAVAALRLWPRSLTWRPDRGRHARANTTPSRRAATPAHRSTSTES